ncbi:L-fuculokinase [Ruminococcus sp. 5_1_39BFAA]|uniref:FGGY-family carbohydrate kinase n=1 Tax=Ruminococcus sp. 5_1_39BFAA TaxID=457412 RepID=UPI003562793B
MAFAGMDVGTSGCKMLVYDLDGNVIFQTSRRYQEEGDKGYRELDPRMVLRYVKEVLKEVGENCPKPIEAMAVTSLGESVVCLDEQDHVLANSMLTGDSRGIPETKRIIDKIGAQRVFEITGLPPNELYGLPKYMWLNENTQAVKKAKAILFYEDFVGYVLTGERKVSYSSAARSMAFDIRKLEWSEEMLAMAGIKKEQMSVPVKPCTIIGTILPEMARELHLNPEMKLIVGGHDQSCAALGSGLKDMTTGECGMGTCEFMFTMLPEAKMTPEMRKDDFTCIPYIIPGTYLSSIEVTTCGALKNWARDTLFRDIYAKCSHEGKNFFAYMDNLAADVRTEVLILPQFGSAGNPDLSMDARGTITGLTIHTKAEELYRALLEGMAFQMYLAYERLEKAGTAMQSIVATGGGAASELTLQIRADVFNRKVFSLKSDESGTLGCMMMAATAAGAYSSLAEAIKRAVKIREEYIPDKEMHAYYMEKFKKYKQLYTRMFDFK